MVMPAHHNKMRKMNQAAKDGRLYKKMRCLGIVYALHEGGGVFIPV